MNNINAVPVRPRRKERSVSSLAGMFSFEGDASAVQAQTQDHAMLMMDTAPPPPSLTRSSTLPYSCPSPPDVVRQVTWDHKHRQQQQQRRNRKNERSISSLSGMFVMENETSTNTTTTTRTTPLQKDVVVMEEDPMEMETEATSLSPPPPLPTFHRQVTIEDDEQQQEQHQQQHPQQPQLPQPQQPLNYSKNDRQQLMAMTRKLRQTKRRLFLKSAIEPTCSVERFRGILLRTAVVSSQADHNKQSSSSLNKPFEYPLQPPPSLLSLRGRSYQRQQQQRRHDHVTSSSSTIGSSSYCEDDDIREENMNDVAG